MPFINSLKNTPRPQGCYMKNFIMNLALFLFLVGIIGFILNRKNIILMIISIEIMLLAVTVLILISSYSFDDNIGQTFSIYIIAIAGAESVIGLSILVAYYRFTYYRISSCLSLFSSLADRTRQILILNQ